MRGTVGAGAVVGQLAAVEQLDQVRAGDAQEVRRLLRGELQVLRSHVDGAATGDSLGRRRSVEPSAPGTTW